jgi:steroid delta-isomerase-like uncharacterized protein
MPLRLQHSKEYCIMKHEKTKLSSTINMCIKSQKGVSAMVQLLQTILKAGSLLLVIAVVMTTGCQQKLDPSQTLKPLVDKYVEVWNGGNLEKLDAIVASNYVYHSNQSADVNGIDGLKKVISGFRTAYPDLKLVVDDGVYAENASAGRWTLTGTNTGAGEMPATGKSVKIWGISILHFANGKITEEWVGFDNQSLMEQLGYTMTPPSRSK